MERSHRTTRFYNDKSALALLQLSFVNQVILEDPSALAQLTLNVQSAVIYNNNFVERPPVY